MPFALLAGRGTAGRKEVVILGKRIFISAICFVLAAALFTGCWGSSSSSSTPPVSSQPPVSSSSSMDSSIIMDDSTSGSLSGSMSGSVSGSMSGSTGSSSVSGSSSLNNGSSAAAPAAATLQGWELRLVNAQNPLPEDFTVETREIAGYEKRLFDARAADALESMLKDAEAAGCKLYLVSAYRSVERQKALFQRKTQSFINEGFSPAEAEKQAAMWVARPGTSEHNLGLAADIVSSDWYKTNSDLTADFEKTPHFAWLKQHAAEYGFILRYPLGKEKITGVTYEPWHYRYVGKQAAQAIMQQGIALEEYTKA